MRADMWRLRLSRRNIFEKIFRRTHALPKKEYTHIERKIGEIGRTVAAHGYPAAEEATIHTVQRNALVIDFEKGIDRAKGGSVCVTVTNKTYQTGYRLERQRREVLEAHSYTRARKPKPFSAGLLCSIIRLQ